MDSEHNVPHLDTTLLLPANQNRKRFRVLIHDGLGWNLNHVFNKLEAEALAAEAQAMGFPWEVTDPDGQMTFWMGRT